MLLYPLMMNKNNDIATATKNLMGNWNAPGSLQLEKPRTTSVIWGWMCGS